jgi:FKBP-type peptidyl-prolyl cis-trans isomerase
MILALGIFSCGKKNTVGESKVHSKQQVTEMMLEANKKAIEVENKQIDNLIDSSGWKMLETETGLRYEIIKKGNGPKAVAGNVVKFNYEEKLLNGELIYDSDQSGPKEFKIGSGGVESGLEEGILLMREGDKARFVIPSYLAHGLSGDQDRIPPKATLLYTIELIYLK